MFEQNYPNIYIQPAKLLIISKTDKNIKVAVAMMFKRKLKNSNLNLFLPNLYKVCNFARLFYTGI